MHKVLLFGAGRIGTAVASLLSSTGDYDIYMADIAFLPNVVQFAATMANVELMQLDVNHPSAREHIRKHNIETVISCLPYYCNMAAATLAHEMGLSYFDLTEDVKTVNQIHALAKGAEGHFVPQCGLAPGLISTISAHLMRRFDSVERVTMRVGGLPVNVSNALNYALTWSTEGLINEYTNPCQAIQDGKEVSLTALEGLEEIKLNGVTYEAFNTSGGVGSLVQAFKGKIQTLDYKTIRYPGHCAKVRFLMHELRLSEHRNLLRQVLENAIPRTTQDMVLMYVAVQGSRDGGLVEENYAGKYKPQRLNGREFSAAQLSTASSLCAVVDLVLHDKKITDRIVRHEKIAFDKVLANRFGQYFVKGKTDLATAANHETRIISSGAEEVI